MLSALLLPAFALTLLEAHGSAMHSPEDFGVIVYAATPSGVMAAVNAARQGQKTALLEPSLYIGGAMSGGLGNTDYGMNAQLIGGSALEVFQRIAEHYNTTFVLPPANQCSWHKSPAWAFEPHVAEEVLLDMLREAGVEVHTNVRIADVSKEIAGTISVLTSVTMDNGRTLAAGVFVDGSYEGTLMKLAGVSYTFGRESNTTYNESCGGRLPAGATGEPYGHTKQLTKYRINPYTDETNTTVIPGVVPASEVVPRGAGDRKVGSYDWRLTLTMVEENKVPIPEPTHYDAKDWELLRRMINSSIALGEKFPFSMPNTKLPNNKSDWKMFGTFGEPASALQWEYPNATWQRQQELVAEHKRYALGLLKFFREDPIVPENFRTRIARYGLCKDEFNRSEAGDHWMSQLYVRTALRMVSDTFLTQRDVMSTVYIGDQVQDRIGLGSYTPDVPGPVQRIVVHTPGGDIVENEGSLQCPFFCDPSQAPFALPYSAMVPRRKEVSNLIVSTAISASHVAFNAIRMEPIWMVLGQAAGVAAATAVNMSIPVADVNVASLQSKLRTLGAVLDLPPVPPPSPVPPAPTPKPLTDDEWYAWKPMWQVGASGTANAITSLQDDAVLKKSYASSKSLPDSDRRFYPAGRVLNLTDEPVQASQDMYWIVRAEGLLTSSLPGNLFL